MTTTTLLRPSDLSKAEDFLRMIAIFASAHEIGVFACLERGVTDFDAIGREVGARPSTLRQLLDCLVTFGVVRADHPAYALDPEWAGQARGDGLLRTAAALQRGVSALDRWRRIPAIAGGRTGGASFEDEMFASGMNLEHYLVGVRDTNLPHSAWLAETLAARLGTASTARVLDMAGGHGRYVIDLMALCPRVDATLADLAQTLAVYHRISAAEPGYARLKTQVCDVAADAIDGRYDLVLLNDLLHSFDRTGKVTVLRRVAAALAPRGQLVVSKFAYENPAESFAKALFSMKLHVNSDGGYLEKDSELPGLLADAGLRVVETLRFQDKISVVAVQA